MFRHHLKVAFRNFQRNKTPFLINLIGLSTGLACALVIYLWVNDELGMDKFHEKEAQLYHIRGNLELSFDVLTLDYTPTPILEELKTEMPEIMHITGINDFDYQQKEGILSEGENQIESKGIYASQDFFNVFTFPLIEGNQDQVLADKNNILLSEALAQKLFATTQNIIGKTLNWKHSTYEKDFQVAGVFKNPPANSSKQFDFILSTDVLLEVDKYASGWNSNSVEAYVVLKEGTDLTAFNEKIVNIVNKKNADNNYASTYNLFAEKYSNQYLYGNYENGVQAGGRIEYVQLFSLIALAILLIACINFMNLSTAQASKKMKEVGVKKTLGVTRKSLIFQFLTESILLALLALLIATQLVTFGLPFFNEIAAKQLALNIDAAVILGFLGITLLTGFIAGCYPAFYLSAFNPIAVLKGKLNVSLGEIWVRKGLVVFQFALTILFIVGFTVIHQQIELAQTKNMGYDRDNIISFEWKGNLYNQFNGLKEGKSNEHFYTFMEELKRLTGVRYASNMTGDLYEEIYGQTGITWTGDDAERDVHFQSPIVGYDFIETFGIDLVEGRTFSKDHQDGYDKVVLNEAAVKFMQLESPIGQTIGLNDGSEVIGVVKDFHYGSLRNGIEPLIFRCEQNGRNVLAKVQRGTERATIQRLQKLHSEFLPGYNFEFNFIDDAYQAQYEAETKISILSKYFAGLAILISCLGLFGLATFTAERRKKEIGIRKILGASVFGIVSMLTNDFTKTVIIAIGISLPISYLLAHNWLANFAFSIELTTWYFLLPSILVLLLAWGTVGLQTVQAARVNPVDCLKEE